MIELYHSASSTCSQKVRIVLAEKQLPWTSRHLDLRRFDQLQPGFLALNAAGVVPVLIDGGCVIRESLVINEYLEDAYPEVPLRPADPAARARMREWTLYIAEEPTRAIKLPSFARNIRPALQGTLGDAQLEDVAARMPNKETAARWVKAVKEGFSNAEIASSLGRLERTLDRMQSALENTAWLACGSYSLADADMAPFVHRLAQLGETAMIETRPLVARWYARVLARPAFRTAMTFSPA